MAQRSSQSSHEWDTFLPSFLQGVTPNSPGVSALSSNNNGHSQYTPANSTLFPAQENPRSSASQQDHVLQAPFSISSANGTNPKVDPSQELLDLLLQNAGPTKQQIQQNILDEVKPVVKKEIKAEISKEIRDLTEEVKRLRSVVAEMEKLWTQLLSYQ